MEAPFVGQKESNHAAIWLVALVGAAALSGLAYFFFAEFEHSPGFDPALRAFLNRYEFLAFAGLGLAGMVIIAMFLYRFEAFSRPAGSQYEWGSGPETSSRQRPERMPVAHAEPKRATAENVRAFTVTIQQKKRVCYGDMVLAPGALYFICFQDESAVTANLSKILISQLGPLGMLISSLLKLGKGKKRERELATKKAEMAMLSLDSRIGHSDYSFRLAPREISLVNKSSWSGNKIEAGNEKYIFGEIEAEAWLALGQWCQEHEVVAKGL